jgi:hypothetical protein
MATLIPTLEACRRRMTSGEVRFAERLQQKLEDDYTVWYDVPLGRRQRHPDFIVLHPARGILILEVKDWRPETIRGGDRHTFDLLVGDAVRRVANPLEQARQYAFLVHELLERDPLLRVAEGPHRGKCVVPYGYGVVFTAITRKQFELGQFDKVMAGDRVICKDEMLESVSPDAFQKRLWEMQSAPFARMLTMPQVDRVRWHLFPEIRVQPGLFADDGEAAGETGGDANATEAVLPDLMRVMDQQQERLARSLGEGHRVIHGVAGSGKTLILGYRAARLAEVTCKPILVLCYNVSLSAKLAHVMKAQGLEQRVSVQSFHKWCSEQLRLYHVPRPPNGRGFFEAMIDAVSHGVDKQQIPRAQYGAVLIDEGHDFKPEWLKLVVQMVDPETNAFLLLYDDAQSIYGGKTKQRKFSLASCGIQAKGRTTILRVNYRNTTEVLTLAYDFAKEYLTPEEADDDGIPLVMPASGGRHGQAPEVKLCPDFETELVFVADRLKKARADGRAWREMAVVYRSGFMGEKIAQRLRASRIPFEWLQAPGGDHRRYDPDADSVKVMTMHSSKGLEFPVVAVPGVGFMPDEREDEKAEARLLYVAMTRAMDQLIVSAHASSRFASRLALQERVGALASDAGGSRRERLDVWP